ncbi:MAG: DUF4253 domain-containing protein [Spirochaetales bacterium]|nr:DUF4253 domain-containing protein [Spirochaetales bacterium]
MKNFFLFPLLLICFYAQALNDAERHLLKDLGFDKALIEELKSFLDEPFYRYQSTPGTANPYSLDFRPQKDFSAGLCFNLSTRKAIECIEKFHGVFKDKGYLLFISQRNHGFRPDQITVIKSTDQFDIVRIQKTAGNQYTNTNTEVIRQLQEWHQNNPFQIIGANFNWIEARFFKAPEKTNILAEEIYRICPDVVDINKSSLENLEKVLNENLTLYLWWNRL